MSILRKLLWNALDAKREKWTRTNFIAFPLILSRSCLTARRQITEQMYNGTTRQDYLGECAKFMKPDLQTMCFLFSEAKAEPAM